MPQAVSLFSRASCALAESSLRALDSLTRRLGRERKVSPHLITGTRGEEAALFYLRRRGYIIVARQWKAPPDRSDLDLIGWDGDTLSFIEVKTRTRKDQFAAEVAVDADKKKNLRRLARVYLRQLPEEPQHTRFDVVSVYFEKDSFGNVQPASFELFIGAFGWQPAHARRRRRD